MPMQQGGPAALEDRSCSWMRGLATSVEEAMFLLLSSCILLPYALTTAASTVPRAHALHANGQLRVSTFARRILSKPPVGITGNCVMSVPATETHAKPAELDWRGHPHFITSCVAGIAPLLHRSNRHAILSAHACHVCPRSGG
jgi:hypothetical protein